MGSRKQNICSLETESVPCKPEAAGDYLRQGGLEKKKTLQYTCVESSRDRRKDCLVL